MTTSQVQLDTSRIHPGHILDTSWTHLGLLWGSPPHRLTTSPPHLTTSQHKSHNHQVDPLDSLLGAFPMSGTRSVGFVILADLLCFTYAHKRHGNSGSPIYLAGSKLRLLRTSLPILADTFVQLCTD